MKKRGNFQCRFRFRNLLRQFKREFRIALWAKLIEDQIMKGRTPLRLKGVCTGEGGMVHGPMMAMVGDDPDRKELIQLESGDWVLGDHGNCLSFITERGTDNMKMNVYEP